MLQGFVRNGWVEGGGASGREHARIRPQIFEPLMKRALRVRELIDGIAETSSDDVSRQPARIYNCAGDTRTESPRGKTRRPMFLHKV
jgi:hypothetical protein